MKESDNPNVKAPSTAVGIQIGDGLNFQYTPAIYTTHSGLSLNSSFEESEGDLQKNEVNPTVSTKMAEGVGFEPTVALRLLLISSQVPLTTQPPFRFVEFIE